MNYICKKSQQPSCEGLAVRFGRLGKGLHGYWGGNILPNSLKFPEQLGKGEAEVWISKMLPHRGFPLKKKEKRAGVISGEMVSEEGLTCAVLDMLQNDLEEWEDEEETKIFGVNETEADKKGLQKEHLIYRASAELKPILTGEECRVMHPLMKPKYMRGCVCMDVYVCVCVCVYIYYGHSG